jgi:hypothetical protein
MDSQLLRVLTASVGKEAAKRSTKMAEMEDNKFAASNEPKGSQSAAKRVRRDSWRSMCFQDYIFTFSSTQLDELEKFYSKLACSPTKLEIKALSSRTKIPQTQIRKWIDEKKGKEFQLKSEMNRRIQWTGTAHGNEAPFGMSGMQSEGSSGGDTYREAGPYTPETSEECSIEGGNFHEICDLMQETGRFMTLTRNLIEKSASANALV